MRKKPQVLILAAGSSSRFFPYNKTHKGFHIITGKPIICHTLHSVKEAGLENVIIVVNNILEQKLVDKHKPRGLKIKFVFQKEALGQAAAILKAKYLLKDYFFLINTQQINFHKYAKLLVRSFVKNKAYLSLACTETSSPEVYGILKLKDARVEQVVEKPKAGNEPSNKRIVGMYCIGKKFLNILEKEKISEYQFENAIMKAIPYGVYSIFIDNESPTLKYPWDIFLIKKLILADVKNFISRTAKIAPTAVIRGPVVIKKNAEINDFAIIEGPAYIGEGSVVGMYSCVRDYSILEANTHLQRYVDLKNSQMCENSRVHSGFIGDSIIGSGTRIGANFITANKRLDRKSIGLMVKDQKVLSSLNTLGAIVGENVRFGINVSTMPGTVVGNNVVVKPNKVIKHMVREKVLVDLDYVLFNTTLFKKYRLSFKHSTKLLYEDTIDFLKAASQIVDLILFTEGEIELQKAKVVKTELSKIPWFKTLYYDPFCKVNNLKRLIRKYDLVKIIDDKPEIIDYAIELGLKAIRVRRGKYSDQDSLQTPFLEVSNLNEIIENKYLY